MQQAHAKLLGSPMHGRVITLNMLYPKNPPPDYEIVG